MPKKNAAASSKPEPKTRPTYNDMVVTAINEVKQRTDSDSSMEDISKYLTENYNLPEGYVVQIKKALVRLIKKEVIVQVKDGFRLNGDLTSSVKKPDQVLFSEKSIETTDVGRKTRSKGQNSNKNSIIKEDESLPKTKNRPDGFSKNITKNITMRKSRPAKGSSTSSETEFSEIEPSEIKTVMAVSVELNRFGMTGAVGHDDAESASFSSKEESKTNSEEKEGPSKKKTRTKRLAGSEEKKGGPKKNRTKRLAGSEEKKGGPKKKTTTSTTGKKR